MGLGGLYYPAKVGTWRRQGCPRPWRPWGCGVKGFGVLEHLTLGMVIPWPVCVRACVPRGRRRPWPTRSRCGAPWPEQQGLAASREGSGLTVGVVGDRMVMPCRGECSDEPVQCHAKLLRCWRCSGLWRSRAASVRLSASLLLLLLRSFFLFLLSSARAGGWWCGSPPRRAGQLEAAKASRCPSYRAAHPWCHRILANGVGWEFGNRRDARCLG